MNRDEMPGAGGPSSERQARYRLGKWSEHLAAFYLIAKGHRILARRLKTPAGEIDLIALKGRRVAFVEVKRRMTLGECEASITHQLRRRVRRAADLWMARNARFQGYDVGFDLIFIRPRSWPVHLKDAL
jgi:putative endonuclease